MRLLLSVVASLVVVSVISATAQQSPFLGRWNMTGTGNDSTRVFWLEVTESDGKLEALFLNRGGHPRPPASLTMDGDELVWEVRGGQNFTFRGRVENGQLVGTERIEARARRGGGPPREPRVTNWVGVRPPTWPPATTRGEHTFGEPVILFDGTFDAFGVQNPNREMGWSIVDGTMNNGDGANNLVSKQKFRDFKIEAEYRLAEGSNSGIYLRGRYELQVLDDYGEPTFDRGHMSVYGRVAPTVNASRPQGEWQEMEAVMVGNRVTVTLNGQRIHDDVLIEGITGGALDAAETEPGPIMIQGDHTGVWFRKLVVTPITGR
jgi:hypothetical protein